MGVSREVRRLLNDELGRQKGFLVRSTITTKFHSLLQRPDMNAIGVSNKNKATFERQGATFERHLTGISTKKRVLL
jgi:hypothetical protein